MNDSVESENTNSYQKNSERLLKAIQTRVQVYNEQNHTDYACPAKTPDEYFALRAFVLNDPEAKESLNMLIKRNTPMIRSACADYKKFLKDAYNIEDKDDDLFTIAIMGTPSRVRNADNQRDNLASFERSHNGFIHAALKYDVGRARFSTLASLKMKKALDKYTSNLSADYKARCIGGAEKTSFNMAQVLATEPKETVLDPAYVIGIANCYTPVSSTYKLNQFREQIKTLFEKHSELFNEKEIDMFKKIAGYIEEHDEMPSFRAIGKLCGISGWGVKMRMKQIEEKMKAMDEPYVDNHYNKAERREIANMVYEILSSQPTGAMSVA